MTFKSILSLIKNQPVIFSLFSLLQILSILTAIYLYSDARSQRIELEKYRGTTLTFELIYNNGIAFSDIEQGIENTSQQEQIPISNITLLLDKENNIVAEYNYNSSQVDMGEPLTKHNDILLGELYAKNNDISVGDEIAFLNRNFTVSGFTLSVSEEIETKQILFNSLKNDDKIYKLYIKLKDLPTKKEKNDFTEILYQNFNEASIVIPEERNYINEYEFDSQLLISFSVMLLVFLNISFIYKYILKIRKNKFTIYKICGCTKFRAFMILFSEILCYFILHSAISLAIWFGFAKDFLIKEDVKLGIIDVILPMIIYFIFSIITFISVIMNYSRQTTIELLYPKRE